MSTRTGAHKSAESAPLHFHVFNHSSQPLCASIFPSSRTFHATMAATNGTLHTHTLSDDAIGHTDSKNGLHRTVTQLTITPEMFEKVRPAARVHTGAHLAAAVPHAHQASSGGQCEAVRQPNSVGLRRVRVFPHLRGDETGLTGGRFVISTMTFAMVLMGWGGANGASALA